MHAPWLEEEPGFWDGAGRRLEGLLRGRERPPTSDAEPPAVKAVALLTTRGDRERGRQPSSLTLFSTRLLVRWGRRFPRGVVTLFLPMARTLATLYPKGCHSLETANGDFPQDAFFGK